jgi:hypothetical protein
MPIRPSGAQSYKHHIRSQLLPRCYLLDFGWSRVSTYWVVYICVSVIYVKIMFTVGLDRRLSKLFR